MPPAVGRGRAGRRGGGDRPARAADGAGPVRPAMPGV